MNSSSFRVGQWVEVRSKEEILATLDTDGRLEGMPFMPEMLAFCGKRFQVYKSAHKTCDTVFPVRGRRLANSVHLQTRCDGGAHGGCEAGCLLFWKDAWLKPVSGPDVSQTAVAHNPSPERGNGRCTEQDLVRATRASGGTDDPDPAYVCQATRLPYATQDLSPYDYRQYFKDLTSGNVGFGSWLTGLLYISYLWLMNLGIGIGAPMRWVYDTFQRIRGGIPYPRYEGSIPMGQPTPTEELNLQEGELVRVKSYAEILATCNVKNKNRGMHFDAEQVPYCGGTYRVQKRVTKILDERTGKLMRMKNPCIILEDVFCRGWYSECRMFCPRAIYQYWREIWLERVEPRQASSKPRG